MSLSKIDNFVSDVKKTHKIDTSKWQEFRIGSLFDCNTAKQLLKTQKGDFPQVNRSAFNNGITKQVKKIDKKVNEPNCITIGAEGFYAFYQDKPFMAGNKIYVLRHNKMNKNSGLFICAVLNSIVGDYSYNNARILEKIKNEVHELPVDKNNEPDWKYMEDFIKKMTKKIESALL
tara:strand:+ start:2030 stop:2554 length:525 start_codon:yes stop_codon:yes gene_type:complete